MKGWWLLLLPCGCVLFALAWLRRRQVERDRADLVPRWAAFIEGEPRIPPANLPSVQPLKAVTVDRFARFTQRLGRR